MGGVPQANKDRNAVELSAWRSMMEFSGGRVDVLSTNGLPGAPAIRHRVGFKLCSMAGKSTLVGYLARNSAAASRASVSAPRLSSA